MIKLNKNIIRKKLILLGLIGIYILVFKILHVTDYLSLEYINTHKLMLDTFVNTHYGFAVSSFIAIIVACSAIALPGSTLFFIAAGLLFGIFPGFVYAIIGFTLGSTVLFLLSRYCIGDWVQRRYADRLIRFNREFDRNGALYIVLLRLVSIIPCFMINIFSGITLIPLYLFMLATMIGMIPASLIFGFVGHNLFMIPSFASLCTPSMLGMCSLVLFAKGGLVFLLYSYFRQRTS